jgi:predicted RND superfamily exporter protein
VGTALAATTIILCTGFLILALSSFSFNRDMALLSAIVITCAAVADGLYLPALLLSFDRRQSAERDTDTVGQAVPTVETSHYE